ncbi:MAG: hypothetical protein HS132_06215 [Planctomycetia bacterium]|nr:hypothetical protein [Planctomycetia bacterium]
MDKNKLDLTVETRRGLIEAEHEKMRDISMKWRAFVRYPFDNATKKFVY